MTGGLGAGLAFGLSPLVAIAQDDPASVRPKAGDLLVKVDDPALKPLRADDIPLGMAQVMAWAMDPAEKIVRRGSRLNRIMLVRLDESRLVGDTKTRAAAGRGGLHGHLHAHRLRRHRLAAGRRTALLSLSLLEIRSQRRRYASSTAPRRARFRRCRFESSTANSSSPDRSRRASRSIPPSSLSAQPRSSRGRRKSWSPDSRVSKRPRPETESNVRVVPRPRW